MLWTLLPSQAQLLRDGEVIGDDTRFEWLWQFIDAIISEMNSASARLATGEIDEEEWASLATALWEDAFIALYLLGRGGEEAMTDDDWDNLSGLLESQDEFFENFLMALFTEMSDAQLAHRLTLYADSSQQAYWGAMTTAKKEAGYIEELWSLGFADHCNTCLTFADEPWMPIGYFPEPGDGHTECMMKCHCHKEYRKNPEKGE